MDELKQLFYKLNKELFSDSGGNNIQQTEDVFKLICLFGVHAPLEIIRGLFMNVKEDKSDVSQPLLKSQTIYVDSLYPVETKRFFQTEVKAEDYFEPEIDESLKNS